MSQTYTISELANEFAVTPRTLRFYESRGILGPDRVGQRRVYNERDRVRLRLALRGRRLGFSVEDCKEIIEMYNPIVGNESDQLEYLLAKISDHRAVLEDKQRDIEATIAAMDEIESLCRAHLEERSRVV
ncbi:MAG: MerR family transcriptional regulator [Chromatiales bacterium]|jgi:DNA-binding transcriptional MerR regulator|nr:MerR family transcriptional regulator [Chromatiales bacterium]